MTDEKTYTEKEVKVIVRSVEATCQGIKDLALQKQREEIAKQVHTFFKACGRRAMYNNNFKVQGEHARNLLKSLKEGK